MKRFTWGESVLMATPKTRSAPGVVPVVRERRKEVKYEIDMLVLRQQGSG